MRKQLHLHILRVSASVKKGSVSQQTGRAASGVATMRIRIRRKRTLRTLPVLLWNPSFSCHRR